MAVTTWKHRCWDRRLCGLSSGQLDQRQRSLKKARQRKHLGVQLAASLHFGSSKTA